MGDLYVYEDCPLITSTCSIAVALLESYFPGMQYFHMHSHYEISMIISGNVSVLLPEQISSGTEPRIVVLQPFTLHHMIPEPDQLYRRFNVSFKREYMEHMFGIWPALGGIFQQNGVILLPDAEQLKQLEQVLSIMEKEKDQERNQYLLMYFLSLLNGIRRTEKSKAENFPKYIHQALLYLNEHFTEHITAEELAKHLGVCRTTLMTGFRSYVGYTIHQYHQNLRLRYAEYLRENGTSVGEAAVASGFCDASGYIRAYKRVYGTTPTGKE